MDSRVITLTNAALDKREIGVERRINPLPYPGIERRSLWARGFHKDDVYGHLLETASGRDWLPAAVVLSRLYKEFLYFETDEELGRLHAEQMVACFEFSLKKRSSSLQRRRHLHPLTNEASSAIYLHFGDNPGSNTEYLETVLISRQPLIFGYQSIEHQRLSRPLLERCASVLEYKVIELRVGK